jgi:hypothetical protein
LAAFPASCCPPWGPNGSELVGGTGALGEGGCVVEVVVLDTGAVEGVDPFVAVVDVEELGSAPATVASKPTIEKMAVARISSWRGATRVQSVRP